MATARKPVSAVQRKVSEKKSVELPVAPELATGGEVKKRKRLAKAFKRPLDKTLRVAPLVREKFSIPENEYEQLVVLKQRLADLGLPAKKSEVVRAGLKSLAALDDAALKDALFGIQLVG